MKALIKDYKLCMVEIFKDKYNISEFEAKKIIKNYDFDHVLKMCNYIALHDDPETWVDSIYEWAYDDAGNEELLEM